MPTLWEVEFIPVFSQPSEQTLYQKFYSQMNASTEHLLPQRPDSLVQMSACFQFLLSLGIVCSLQIVHGHNRVFPWQIGSKEDLVGIFHSVGTNIHPVTSQPVISFLSLWISWHFLDFSVNGIIHYRPFLLWLLLLSIIINIFRFIPVEAGMNKQFIFVVVELNPIVQLQSWFFKSVNLLVYI